MRRKVSQLWGACASSSSISITFATGAVFTFAARPASTSSVVPGSCPTTNTVRAVGIDGKGNTPCRCFLLCFGKWQAEKIDPGRDDFRAEKVALFCEFCKLDPVDNLPDHAVRRAARDIGTVDVDPADRGAARADGHGSFAPRVHELGRHFSTLPVLHRGYGCLSPG